MIWQLLSLNLFWYNISPPYNNWAPLNHSGETRDDRFKKRLLVNPTPIVTIVMEWVLKLPMFKL